MKIAVLTDIHSNLFALQAVTADLEAWGPDLTIVAGDIVNRGSRPAQCLEFIQQRQAAQGWLVIRGNHEDYVISQGDPMAPRTGIAFDVHLPSFWTYEQLHRDVSCLNAMPEMLRLPSPDHRDILVYHASLVGNRDGIYPETSEPELASKVGYGSLETPASLFVVGHTHRAMVRPCRQTMVVNAGSAGLPFDGDTRPTYARLAWQAGAWHVEIQRVAYDLHQAVCDFRQAGYLDGAGPLAQVVYQELVHARSLLFGWASLYQARILRGEISLSASVDLFLSDTFGSG